MSKKTRRMRIATTLEQYATEYRKRIGQSGTTLEDLDNIARICIELLSPLLWIPVSEGLPKKPIKDVRYMFRYKDGEYAIYDYSIEAHLWGGFPIGVLRHDEFLEMVEQEFTHYQLITSPEKVK